jgi:hypothetical protein
MEPAAWTLVKPRSHEITGAPVKLVISRSAQASVLKGLLLKARIPNLGRGNVDSEVSRAIYVLPLKGA